jgi:hypothetical protein
LTYCFYALMGGFVIAVPRDNQDGTNTTSFENYVDIYPLEVRDFGKCFTGIVIAKNAGTKSY